MLSSLVRFSINYHGVAIFLAMLMMFFGIYQFSNAGLDIFPEFSPKQVVIQTEAPGYSSEQVEILVTQPIENALSGIIGLETIRSESIQGLSIIQCFFDESSNIQLNRQVVSERLVTLGSQLPEGVGPAAALPLSSSSATIMTIGATSGTKNLMELRSMIQASLVPRILSVPGVADINVFGGDVRELQVLVKPEKLEQFAIDIKEVGAAALRATGIYGTGFIENDNQRFTLRIDGQPVSPETLAAVVLKQEGLNTVVLGDVADIQFAAEPSFGAASIMTEAGIVMMIIGQYQANTLTVTEGLEQVLADMKPILAQQGVTLHADLFRPANYIEESIKNLSGHLLLGGLFVVLVLALFLFNIKTAFISAIAIPLSLIGAIIVLLLMDINLNIMVLGGLAIALGEVVDDAIIDTENIFRRLRENQLAEKPRHAMQVVFNASMEVRSSVVYASFIVAAVFIPLLTLGGVAGRLFSPLGFSYILAILMSLFIALTVTPALCYSMLGQGKITRTEPPVFNFIKPIYARCLNLSCEMPILTLLASLSICLVGFTFLPGVGGQFLPDLREGHYIVHTTSKPGTSLKESIRHGNALTTEFLSIEGVESVSQWAGRAERSADTFGSHYSEYDVELAAMSGKEQQHVLDQLRSTLANFPGILFEAHNFLTERIYETISGYSSPVVVNIYGKDFHELDVKAREVSELIKTVEGSTDVQIRSPPGTPLIKIHLLLDNLAHYGLRPVDIMETVQLAYGGYVVGRFQDGSLVQNVRIILDASDRSRVGSLSGLPVKTPDGLIISLEDIAEIRQEEGRYNVLHQNAQRLQTVTANVSGRDVVSFMDEIKRRVLSEIEFDTHTVPEFTGAAIEQRRARGELVLHSILVGVIVLILIFIATGSAKNTFLILLNLPFSLVGGVLAVYVTSTSLSVGSLVGFVTLFGITVRNSIMLISHYSYLVNEEGAEWCLETVIRGAEERLPSILMTGLVTALAMLPIAIDSDNAGREIMGPMAAIIIGGLTTSTLLNLLIMPAVMFKFGSFKQTFTIQSGQN